MIGTYLPGLVLSIVGAIGVGSGHHSEVPLGWHYVIPPFAGFASMVLIVSNFLAYAGMEVNAVHDDQLSNPAKDYPKGILPVFIPPTLVMAVPRNLLGLISGITAAFEIYFQHLAVNWLTPLLSLMVVLGVLASVVTWIAGPSKGLLIAGRTGLLPVGLPKRKAQGMQQGILIPQGIIVTLLSAIFVFVPNVSEAFFILIAAAAQLYLLMYLLRLLSAIRLRRTQPTVHRAYRVPMMSVVAGIGFLASLAGFVLGFIPPSEIGGLTPIAYFVLVLVITGVLAVLPLIFYAVRNDSWHTISDEEFAELIGEHVTPPSRHAVTTPTAS